MAIGLGRARLGIPRVNANPKPPRIGQALKTRLGNARPAPQGPWRPKGEAKSTEYARSGTAIGQAKPLTAPKPVATGTALPSNTVAGSTPGSTSAASSAPPAPAPSVPNERFPIPTWTPATSGEKDPRDPVYWENLAKLRFQDQQEYKKSEADESTANAAYDFAKQEAIRNRAIQERQLGEGAIKGNLSASGWLNRTQGEQVADYTSKQAAAELSHEQELDAFQAARKALQEGFGIEAATLLAEAGGRFAAQQEKEAEKGAAEATSSAAAATGTGRGLSGNTPLGRFPMPTKSESIGPGHPAGGNPKKAAIAQRRRKAR